MNDATRPTRPEPRPAGAKRQRILDAARQCFIDHGFHAASMAQIAQAADVSVGLAYRYFDSKQAIMLAIIEQQLQVARERLQGLCSSQELLSRVLDKFGAWQRADPGEVNPALFLDISAHARRAPATADALQRSDAMLRGEFLAWLQRDHERAGHPLTPRQAEARALALQCVVEGMLVRAAREPALPTDLMREALAPLLAQLVEPAVARPSDDIAASRG